MDRILAAPLNTGRQNWPNIAGVICFTLRGPLLLCDEPQHEISQFQQIS